MYVGKCVSLYIFIYLKMYVGGHDYVFMCGCIYVSVCMYVCRQTCISLYMYICMYVDIHT